MTAARSAAYRTWCGMPFPPDRFALARERHIAEVKRAMASHLGRCAASHESVAIVEGLPVFAIPDKPQLTRIDGRRRNGTARAVTAALHPDDVWVVRGIPVTSPARTVVDIARMRQFHEAMVTADAALARGIARETLQAVLEPMSRWPGVRSARLVVQWADERMESPGESVVRARCITNGLELPEPQFWVRDPEGNMRRVDFLWKSHQLIGEMDGMVKYATDPNAFALEKMRQEALEACYHFIRWTWSQALAPDEVFVGRLLAAMARGDRLVRAGIAI
jgi:hypothetical protein